MTNQTIGHRPARAFEAAPGGGPIARRGSTVPKGFISTSNPVRRRRVALGRIRCGTSRVLELDLSAYFMCDHVSGLKACSGQAQCDPFFSQTETCRLDTALRSRSRSRLHRLLCMERGYMHPCGPRPTYRPDTHSCKEVTTRVDQHHEIPLLICSRRESERTREVAQESADLLPRA